MVQIQLAYNYVIEWNDVIIRSYFSILNPEVTNGGELTGIFDC